MRSCRSFTINSITAFWEPEVSRFASKGSPSRRGISTAEPRSRKEWIRTENSCLQGQRVSSRLLPAGQYHTPCLGYPAVRLWIPKPEIGYPRPGTWCEPTGPIGNVPTESSLEIPLVLSYEDPFPLGTPRSHSRGLQGWRSCSQE